MTRAYRNGVNMPCNISQTSRVLRRSRGYGAGIIAVVSNDSYEGCRQHYGAHSYSAGGFTCERADSATGQSPMTPAPSRPRYLSTSTFSVVYFSIAVVEERSLQF